MSQDARPLPLCRHARPVRMTMETLILYMLESATLASKRADTGNMPDAAHWYYKAAYWARRVGDAVAAQSYHDNAVDCGG